jgi:myo-inositol-1(or 4)-monophosphatase
LKNKGQNLKYLNFFINDIKAKIDKINFYFLNKKTKFISKSKTRINPVTILDKKIEKLIRKVIIDYFPNHSIIGEESKPRLKNSEYTWIIDPLDGTKNFIMGLPTWSNLVGLLKNQNPLLSFANFPVLNKYYLAKGNNSYVCGKENKLKKIFTNKKIKNLNEAKIAVNTFNTIKNKKIFKFVSEFKGIIKITNIDAYNFCLLSEGKIDVLIETGLKKVDFYPLLALLKNSGAVVTDWYGNKDFNKGQLLVTANKALHKKIIIQLDL